MFLALPFAYNQDFDIDMHRLDIFIKNFVFPLISELGPQPQRNYHEGRAALRHYANQPARPL